MDHINDPQVIWWSTGYSGDRKPWNHTASVAPRQHTQGSNRGLRSPWKGKQAYRGGSVPTW